MQKKNCTSLNTHPAYYGGDCPAEPVTKVENQEAAHWDKEALWTENNKQDQQDINRIRLQ